MQIRGGINEWPSVEKNMPICVFRTWDDGAEAKTEKSYSL